MVIGISRQVIVVHSPDQKLFDQAIFILNDDAIGKDGITDEMLLKSADKLLRDSTGKNRRRKTLYGPAWACGGGLMIGLIWLLTVLI